MKLALSLRAAVAATLVAAAPAQVSSLISIDAAGNSTPSTFGGITAVSGDGRFVIFLHEEPLVPPFTGLTQVYLRDRLTQQTSIVSLDSTGTSDAPSGAGVPTITPDGTHLAFSTDDPLVPGDANGGEDIYVRNRLTGALVNVTLGSSDSGGNLVNARPSLSADGRFVAFESSATNLIGNDTNGTEDIYVADRDGLLRAADRLVRPGCAGVPPARAGRRPAYHLRASLNFRV